MRPKLNLLEQEDKSLLEEIRRFETFFQFLSRHNSVLNWERLADFGHFLNTLQFKELNHNFYFSISFLVK